MRDHCCDRGLSQAERHLSTCQPCLIILPSISCLAARLVQPSVTQFRLFVPSAMLIPV